MITCLYFLIICFGYVFSQQDITPSVSITIEVPPVEFLKQYANGTINMYVKKGNNMVLECSVFNMPTQGNIFWKKYPYKGGSTTSIPINKGLTSYDLSKFKIGQGKQPNSIRLEILTVDESFAGIYACEVMYSANVVNAKAERTLMIYDLPQITYTEFKNQVDSGKDITFSCLARGIPAPSVLWKRIGGNTNIIKNTGVVLYNNEVTLTKVTHNDAGVYACYAENEWGSEERKFALAVTHSPVISITPNGNDANQMVGCMIQLTCVVKANPAPAQGQIIWSANTTGTLIAGGRITIKMLTSSEQEIFSILRIYPTTSADISNILYMCSASNSLGSDTGSVSFRQASVSNPLITGPFPCGSMALSVSFYVLLISLFSIFFST